MSDFHIDPEVIGPLPGGLRERRAGLDGAATLPAPDTGASTPATLVAVQRISGRATSLADGLGGLADRIDASLALTPTPTGRYAASSATASRGRRGDQPGGGRVARGLPGGGTGAGLP